jgi:hypothetical protein
MAITPTVEVFCNCTYRPSVDWIATVESLLLTRFVVRKTNTSRMAIFSTFVNSLLDCARSLGGHDIGQRFSGLWHGASVAFS